MREALACRGGSPEGLHAEAVGRPTLHGHGDWLVGSAPGESSWTLGFAAQARRMLREADDNGDGVISKAEFHDLFANKSTPDGLEQYDARYKPPLNGSSS